MYENLANSFE